jgi:TetR/AcrR family transcriptional regulator
MEKACKPIAGRQPGRPGKDEPDRAPLLLRAAQTSFASLGFRAATVRGIAAAAGVDHTLVCHRFGSKEALWNAVIEQQSLYLAPFIAKLKSLQSEREVPIRVQIEATFRQLIAAIFGEPECGLLFARISSERGKHLDLLVEKLLRPAYDALYPLLVEAVEAEVIRKQRLDLLYFMTLNALAMSVSSRHVLGYFGEDFHDFDRLKEDMSHFVIVNFFDNESLDASGIQLRKQQKQSGRDH